MQPLTQEEVKEFNEIVMHLERAEKDEVLKNVKEKTGDEQTEYIRSVINSKQ